MKIFKNSIIAFAVTFSAHVSAWKSATHMLVTRIAFETLKSESPQTVSQIETILKQFETNYPTWTTKEGKYCFVEAATFADDIKYKGGGY